MYQIRPWLYVGKYRETLNPHLLAVHQIGAMLQLAEVVKSSLRRQLWKNVSSP